MTHDQNITRLREAVLGEEVRSSMIELFNEDYGLVKKAVGVGTEISSPTSSIDGYYEGNIYINNQTMDLWMMDGFGWTKVGNLKTISLVSVDESSVDDGQNVVNIMFSDGTSQSFNIKNGSKGTTGYAITGAVDNGDGTFYLTISNGTRTSNISTIRGLKGETGEKGAKGDTGEKGRDVTSILMSGTGKQHPITATYSDGTQQVIGIINDGNDGSGIGDMLKSTYDKSDRGFVDMAGALTDGTTTIPMSTVQNKADKSTTLNGYGITDAYTKSQVDEKLEEVQIHRPEMTQAQFDALSDEELKQYIGQDILIKDAYYVPEGMVSRLSDNGDIQGIATRYANGTLNDKNVAGALAVGELNSEVNALKELNNSIIKVRQVRVPSAEQIGINGKITSVFTVPTIEGYKAVGVIGYSLGENEEHKNLCLYLCELSTYDNKLYYYIYNHSNSTFLIQPKFDVLYVRSELF